MTLIGVLLLAPANAAWADFRAGLSAYNKGDYETAVKEWQGPAEKGHIQALNGMGFLYMNGRGVAKDNARALGYFLIAAKTGFRPRAVQRRAAVWAHQGRDAQPEEGERVDPACGRKGPHRGALSDGGRVRVSYGIDSSGFVH